MLLDYDVEDGGDGLSCTITVLPADGYGDQFWGVVVAERVMEIIYLPEDVTTKIDVVYPELGLDVVPVDLVPLGDWPDDYDVDLAYQQRDFVSDKSKLIQVEWDAVIEELEAYGDNGQLSNWSFPADSVQRFRNCRAVDGQATQGEIDVVLTDAAGTRTVSLQLDDRVLASGSRSGDGSVTLTEQNDSGLSGTVDVTYTADLALGSAFMRVRWAKVYEIHIDTAALSFPRTAEYEANDTGLANRLAKQMELTAGTYNYLVRAESDTGIDSTNTASQQIVVTGRPDAPGEISLQSPPGDWSGTKIQFEASATAGATYRVYDCVDHDDIIDFETVVATPGAGSGTIQVTLPASPGGAAAGIRRVCVVALAGGIEDARRRRIKIEYDASGDVILPRPNIPIGELSSISGRALTIAYSYDHTDEPGVATDIQLFLLAEGDALPADGATPDATANLAQSSGVEYGTIAATALADGWYYAILRAATTDGVQSANSELTEERWLSTAAPVAPANQSAEIVG